ncbi:MAG TPA: response regulator [Anaerolineales bacterium]|nr:response regulator [Anaerolineales bacterium]
MTKPLALIIEDDLEIAKILSLSLKGEFEVEILADGNAAIARLAQVVPVLIMLDLHLPDVSGMDVFAHIRSDARFHGTKIILCTADALRAEALQSQVDLVLLKPISPSQLRELASRMIKTMDDRQ